MLKRKIVSNNTTIVKRNKNRNIIQSHTVTVSRYDFDVIEKRILYRTIEFLQSNNLLNKTSDDEVKIILSTASILPKWDVYNTTHALSNYTLVKKALTRLLDKKMFFEDKENRIWKGTTVVMAPEHNWGTISFKLHKDVYKALLDISYQYHKFDIDTIISFRSAYSMRFYELFSNQKKALTYDIITLKDMFQLKDKYKQIRHFISRVIDVAKKELDAKASYSFNYELIKADKGKRIKSIKFFPVYLPNNRSADQKRLDATKALEKKIDLSEFLTQGELMSLKELGFTENRLKKNLDLLEAVSKARRRGIILITPTLIWYVHKNANNKQGYFLKALRNNISELEGTEQKTLFKSTQTDSDVKTNKELESVTSFLQGFIGLTGDTLTNGIIYVMNHGGSSYLNELFSLDKSKKDTEDSKTSLVEHIVNCNIRDGNDTEIAITKVSEPYKVQSVKLIVKKTKKSDAISVTPNVAKDESIVEPIEERELTEKSQKVETQREEVIKEEIKDETSLYNLSDLSILGSDFNIHEEDDETETINVSDSIYNSGSKKEEAKVSYIDERKELEKQIPIKSSLTKATSQKEEQTNNLVDWLKELYSDSEIKNKPTVIEEASLPVTKTLEPVDTKKNKPKKRRSKGIKKFLQAINIFTRIFKKKKNQHPT